MKTRLSKAWGVRGRMANWGISFSESGTLVLTGRMSEASASSYLSGLLIGREVRDMARKDDVVHLIGEGPLCALYKKALNEFGVNSA